MTIDRSFVERNRTATERIRSLVANLSDDELEKPVGEHWTVSVALAHLAFWDRRMLATLDVSEKAGKLTIPPIDIVVNDISLAFWQVIPPREAARLVMETAETLDQRLEALSLEWIEQIAAVSTRYLERAIHRNLHLDEVEAALKG